MSTKTALSNADKAKLLLVGNQYEDFEIGQVFDHHWGRTLIAATMRNSLI